jgi:predicted AAA+ superfamily ATPase
MPPNEEDLIKAIRLHSPWIYTSVNAIESRIAGTSPRAIEERIYNNFLGPEKEPRILIFTGSRNIGKTKLAERLIHRLFFEKNVPKSRVLFFTCDERRYPLEDIIETYSSQVLGEGLSELKSTTYIFFDEVQYTEDWVQVVKKYSDLSADKLYFIITGSSSAKITPQADRYLTGRFRLKPVYPVKFSEFLIRKSENPELAATIRSMTSEFGSSAHGLFGDMGSFFEFLNRHHERLVPFLPEIKKRLEDYLVYGGFPRYTFKGLFEAYRYKQLLNEAYAKDIKKKSFFDFMALLSIIAENEVCEKGMPLFEKATGMDSKTIEEILELAKSSHLLEFVEPFSGSEIVKGKTGRIKKKYYISDRGLRNLITTNFLDNNIDFLKLNSDEQGKNAEAFVRDILARILYHAGYLEPRLFYFTGKRSDRGIPKPESLFEVDFVIEFRDILLGVDVRYQSTFDERDDLSSLKEFGLKKRTAKTILVSKDTLEKFDKHMVVPLYLFCLLV